MRIMKLTGTILGLFALGALGGTACFDIAGDDVLMGRICEDGSFDCFATTTTTTGPKCDGDPTQDASLVRDECGVFVKPGATGGDGTMASPFGSFADAAKSSSAWVFACEGEYTETEGVVFGGDVAVYGGFTGCGANWKWSADAKAKITGPADVIAVTLTGGTSLVTNVDVTAADAEKDGGSSIAVLVNGGTVEIRNGDLTSGSAKAGAVGESLNGDKALDGVSGAAGVGVCASGASNPGPVGEVKSCDDGTMTIGGSGGDGGLLVGPMEAGSGTDGQPVPDPNPNMKGLGGGGEGVSGATECSSGADGASGGDGAVATAVSGMGSFSAAGYVGVPGEAGEYGKPDKEGEAAAAQRDTRKSSAIVSFLTGWARAGAPAAPAAAAAKAVGVVAPEVRASCSSV